MSSPVGDCSCTPAPDPLLVDEPSTWRIQFKLGRMRSCSSSGVNSIKKSTRTCDFAAVRFLYTMSCSLSSIAHLVNRPDWLVLCITVQSGWLESTSIVCD
ncbi:hypothetical protein YC2023_058853 [Brassica napus]